MNQVITLPWPPKELSPNARMHHMALYKAKKAYKTACILTAKSQGLKAVEAQHLHLHLVFFKPTKRAMDLDNCLGCMKAGLDGLADVLGVDDSKWHLSMEFAPVVGGIVRVTVGPHIQPIADAMALCEGVEVAK